MAQQFKHGVGDEQKSCPRVAERPGNSSLAVATSSSETEEEKRQLWQELKKLKKELKDLRREINEIQVKRNMELK